MSEAEEKITQELRALSHALLEEGKVSVVIGCGAASYGKATRPVFVTSPDEVDRLLWNQYCINNLAVYLTKPEIRQIGRPAIVAKGCDVRALVVIMRENQVRREDVIIIGVGCEGVRDFDPHRSDDATSPKCLSCKVRTPALYDHLIGGEVPPQKRPPDLSEVERIEKMTWASRWEFWQEELRRCIKCYACRAVCPMCYCESCFVEKTRPAWTSSSSSRKANFFFHLFRAFHLAGRCVGCSECERVCPQGIPLGLLNQKLAKEAEALYSHVAGMDPEASAPLLNFEKDESEDFIM